MGLACRSKHEQRLRRRNTIAVVLHSTRAAPAGRGIKLPVSLFRMGAYLTYLLGVSELCINHIRTQTESQVDNVWTKLRDMNTVNQSKLDRRHIFSSAIAHARDAPSAAAPTDDRHSYTCPVHQVFEENNRSTPYNPEFQAANAEQQIVE